MTRPDHVPEDRFEQSVRAAERREKRPEHVRCENCCYFEPNKPHPSCEDVMEGFCFRNPPTVLDGPAKEFPEAATHAASSRTHGNLWCGEFRDSWPNQK